LGNEFGQNALLKWKHCILLGASALAVIAINDNVATVVCWLQDNYAPPAQALEPASFMQRRDTLMDGPDNIDWLVA
jgi:hypothetical protein